VFFNRNAKERFKIFAYYYPTDIVVMGKFDDIDYYGESLLNVQGSQVILNTSVMRFEGSSIYHLTTLSTGFFWDFVKPEFNSPPRFKQIKKYVRKKKLEKLNDSNN
jgi:hypothetical protein